MKKLILIISFLAVGILLLADEKKIPERPSNIPEDVEWSTYGWKYKDNLYTTPSILWYQKGNLYRLFYDTEDKKNLIDDYYYENGKLKIKNQRINFEFLKEEHKKITDYSFGRYVGKQLHYYENGKVKEERCYTFLLKKDKTLENVMCGSEIYYDETGKEIKRIEHDVKCEYGCEEVPRTNVEKLIAQVKSYKDKSRNRSLVRLPVVGKIISVGSWSKNIEVEYKTGFELIPGDQICCLIEGDIVSFECKSNDNGKGIFELKEDKGKKYSSVNEKSEPRFYKKNEVKYTDYLKSGSKPKAGDVKIIAGIEFVYIPAGSFNIHDKDNPKKLYRRDIKAFWMTKYEVTLGEFIKYSYEENKKLPVNNENKTFDSRYPAVLDKYHDMASDFCSWFGKKHGIITELPETDEWEYAARAGTDTDYYWGKDKIEDYTWYKKNSGGKLHPVGQKKPNAFGLYDMIGNAWEWINPLYLRGGGCRSDGKDLQYSTKYMIHYDYWDDHDISNPYQSITDQGTGFRMIIRVP